MLQSVANYLTTKRGFNAQFAVTNGNVLPLLQIYSDCVTIFKRTFSIFVNREA